MRPERSGALTTLCRGMAGLRRAEKGQRFFSKKDMNTEVRKTKRCVPASIDA